MAEPACLAISSRKVRSGSRRISRRYPASSHHKDRVHTLAPRPTRGIGFNGGTGATKKRLACARRPASVALFRAHSDDYSPTLSIGQAIGQVSRSTAVGLPAVAAASGQSGHRRLAPDSPKPPSLSAQAVGWQDASRWSALGPRSIGPRRSSTGTNGQPRYGRIAGQAPIGALASGGEGRRRWVRIPPPPRFLPLPGRSGLWPLRRFAC
jgi:hypothetical protein